MKLRLLVFTFFVLLAAAGNCFAQDVKSPDSKNLFEEDSDRFEKQQERKANQMLKSDRPANQDVDFEAPEIELLQEENTLRGSGGVIISLPGLQVQSESADYNVDTKESTLEGSVLITTDEGVLSAESGKFNVEKETGSFSNAEFGEEGKGYHVNSKDLIKKSEYEYELNDCWFSTCHCDDGTKPWKINTSEADITEDEYAQTYNTYVDFHGVPFVYTPYLAFPVKQERQSGLLVPEFGYSSRDGAGLVLPIFIVIDDSSDITLTPFVETETRIGSELDFRKAFSKQNNLEGRVIYSNESWRDGDLRGTNVDGLYDPTFDEDRVGGFYKHLWRSESGASMPTSFVADVHLVSDDLFLREFDDPDIGKRFARYTTSTAALRTQFSDYFYGSLSGEFNQAMETNDDLVFQRLPTATIFGAKSFRPFGFNPYGLKVTPAIKLEAIDFDRKEGFDGWRYDIAPSVKIPFHYKNYFSSDLELKASKTIYQLDDTTDPDDGSKLDDSSDRDIYSLSYKIGTAVERVYGLDEGSWLTTLTSLGKNNQENRLRRIKHTVDPFIKYTYTPKEDQSDQPLFDSYDRLRERNVFSYGFNTRLLGRFTPLYGSGEEIPELTPRVDELPSLFSGSPLADLGDADDVPSGAPVSMRNGEVRDLMELKLKQTFDYNKYRKNKVSSSESLSDINAIFGLYPNPDFAVKLDSNIEYDSGHFSSWGLSAHFRDDRGDKLRARYSYIDESVSQLEGNLEIVLSERFSAGYYGRYDEQDNEFVESRLALRLASACDCWFFDLGFEEQTNPDKSSIFFSFTFAGLGDITQNQSYNDQN